MAKTSKTKSAAAINTPTAKVDAAASPTAAASPETQEPTNPAPIVDASAGASSTPPAASVDSAAGDQSTNTPRATTEGGAGAAASPAAGADALRAELENAGSLAKAEKIFEERFPLFVAASRQLKASLPKDFAGSISVRITSKKDNFRRAGMAHSGTKVYSDPGRLFSPEQMEQLLGEPRLKVELVVGEGH